MPPRLIDRADARAAVPGEERTDVLLDALREYLQEAAHDDALTQEIAAAYDDEITFEQLEALVLSSSPVPTCKTSLDHYRRCSRTDDRYVTTATVADGARRRIRRHRRTRRRGTRPALVGAARL